jgi:N-acetylneuraminate synthase
MTPFAIGGHSIAPGAKPFIIAELSGNHNQSLEKALNLVDLAAEAGADAVKIQTYTPDSITLECNAPDFLIRDPKSLWFGKTLYELYQEACTPYDWHQAIFERCAAKGLLCFSTPFDEAAVDFLEQFDPPCYKIASFENNHYPLIERVVATKKPIIISLGLSSKEEIANLKTFLDGLDAEKVVFLKCTSSYPASPEATNLKTIPFLREMLDVNVGLSDHTLGIGVSVASIALGAQVIEKHFTTSRSEGGVDAAFSLEPAELRALVAEAHKAWLGLGSVCFDLSEAERRSLQFKRSIYVAKDIPAGDVFTAENIRIVRPGMGLHPKHFASILGKRAAFSLHRGQALGWDMVKG